MYLLNFLKSITAWFFSTSKYAQSSASFTTI